MTRRNGFLLPLLSLAVSLLITLSILGMNLTTPYLTTSGLYNTTQRAIYITGTTIIATLLTLFITTQIQDLLLRRIDNTIQQSAIINRQWLQSSQFKAVNASWRTVLGISSLLEKARNLPIEFIYLLTGLITTAIVTSFTPSVTTRLFPYSPTIPCGPSPCAAVVSNLTDTRDYSWKLANGSSFFIPANAGGCPTRQAVTLAGNINVFNPAAFAYADEGVAVHSTAIGTPISVYSSQKDTGTGLNDLLSIYGSSVVSTAQCVPVMVKNPISCHRGGAIEVDSATEATVISDDGMCSYTEQFLLNPEDSSVMVMQMCSHGDVGQGTIVLGAIRYYAYWLAISIVDTANSNASTYTVTCSVDTRDVYEYRMVTLGLQNPNISESSYSRTLIGQDPCIPEVSTIDDILISTSAAANWQLLQQNAGVDGWFDSIGQLTFENTVESTGISRQSPWAFNNSINALEDVLGLTAALVASRRNSSMIAINGSTIVTTTRVGSGYKVGLIFIIPSAAATTVLLYLIWTTRSIRTSSCTTDLSDMIDFGKKLASDSGNSPLIRESWENE